MCPAGNRDSDQVEEDLKGDLPERIAAEEIEKLEECLKHHAEFDEWLLAHDREGDE